MGRDRRYRGEIWGERKILTLRRESNSSLYHIRAAFVGWGVSHHVDFALGNATSSATLLGILSIWNKCVRGFYPAIFGQQQKSTRIDVDHDTLLFQ